MDWIDLPKQRVNIIEEDMDGHGNYMVVDPSTLYRGKSYGEWTCDWVSWFLSSDADRRNSGPVVFLRSKGLPDRMTGANISDVPTVPGEDVGSETFADSNGQGLNLYGVHSYMNDPNVRVGGDKLSIFEDQAVFVPIIVAFRVKTDSQTDWGRLQDLTGLTIDYGDNPPDICQLTINDRDIDLPLTKTDDMTKDQIKKLEELGKLMGKQSELHRKIWDNGTNIHNINNQQKKNELIQTINKDVNEITTTKIKKAELSRELPLMERFRIQTPIFNTIIPEAPYGRSAKDFIEEAPISPGSYLAMADGYFVLLKFGPGLYWVHSWASAPREGSGPYFSELLYQIEVHPRRKPHGKVTRWRPPRNERLLRQILAQKHEKQDLTTAEENRFNVYLQSASMRKA